MRIPFTFDPMDHADTFSRQGFVHIRGGVGPDLLDEATAQLDRHKAAGGDISARFDRRGLKDQFLFDFPDDPALVDSIVDMVAAVTGLAADDLVLSERHFKVYRAGVDRAPPPHKDRRSSQIAMGIPIRVPPSSRVILYPDVELWENPYDSYDELLKSLPPEASPDRTLAGIAPVEIYTAPGDLFLFRGSCIYHERLDAAGTEILYLKWNALGLDPIGENLPVLPRSRQRVAAGSDRPVLSALDGV